MPAADATPKSDAQEKESPGVAGSKLFQDVINVIQKHHYMEQPWHYVIAGLFVMQAWVSNVLPVVFYLFTGGTPGTGKTNFLNLVATLTDALKFQEVSLSAMARAMRHGRTVTLDEYDPTKGEYDEVRDALLRNGYKSDAPKYTRYDAAARKVEEIPIFGPRLLGYRGGLETALQDRGYLIPAVKPKGKDAFDYVLRNFWPEYGDLVDRLKSWGATTAGIYSPHKLKQIANSAKFKKKVEAVVEEIGANRQSELGTIALLVAEMAGVDVLKELKDANELREMEVFAASDPAIDQLREVIADQARMLGLASGPEIELGKQEDIRRELNLRRGIGGERPIGSMQFKKLVRDVGIKEAWRRNRHGSLYWVVPRNAIPILTASLTPPNPPPPPDDSTGGKVDQVDQVGQAPQRRIGDAWDKAQAPATPPNSPTPPATGEGIREGQVDQVGSSRPGRSPPVSVRGPTSPDCKGDCCPAVPCDCGDCPRCASQGDPWAR